MHHPFLLKSGIYKIVNRVTGECYVGSTVNFYKRKHTHFSLLRSGKSHSLRLQASFDKYGESAFAFEVVERCTKELLHEKESHWMKQLDCVASGFNVSLDVACPTRGFKHSDESRQRMSQAQSRTIRSEESKAISRENFRKAAAMRKGTQLPALHRQRISDANRGRIMSAESRAKMSISKTVNPPRNFLGKKHTEESRLKMSASHLGKKGKNHPRSKPILQLDPAGRVLAEFESAAKAADALGPNFKRSNIKNCLTNISKTAYGFGWKYKADHVSN